MLQTFDPFLIQFGGGYGIRWYGLSYLAGFFCAYLIMIYLSKRRLSSIPQSSISDFVFTVALGTIIGGRLGYCIFYSPDLLWRFSGTFPFWGVLAVNEGGMASHGGIAGIIISAVWYARKHGFSALHAVDLCALTGPVGVFFGRIANFINGELVGRPAPEGFPLGVKFPQDILLWPTYEPEKLNLLTDAASQIGISPQGWQTWLQNLNNDHRAWQAVHTALNRIVEATQENQAAVVEAIEPILTLRHPSQLYEAVLEGLFLFIALAAMWKRGLKSPGLITGLFLTLYAAVRILGEQFRMPDAHIGFQLLGMTRGQWLSVAMLLVGVVFTAGLRKKRA